MQRFNYLFVLVLSPNLMFAAEKLDNLEVIGHANAPSKTGLVNDEIQQTEIIDEAAIQKKQAASLNEAIQSEPGINVSAECSMCGVKRVMINGMKGEHTTVLVDGVPTHTMVSGFYGLDGVSSAGVSRIEIARGAGASLIAPEAIGGTVNIVTKNAEQNGVVLDIATGDKGYKKYSVVGTGVSKDQKSRALLSAQYDTRDQEDNDANGVNESPALENHNLSVKLNHQLDDSNEIELRIAEGNSHVFGGPMLGDIALSETDAIANYGESPSFANDDVRQRYLGLPGDTAEVITTKRHESVAKWRHDWSDDTQLNLTLMQAESQQDSFYEGIDYVADDQVNYADFRLHHYLNDSHRLTAGIDIRDEQLRSRSTALEALNSDADPDTVYISDSFDYQIRGLYLQDTWTPTENLEIASAVRFDQVSADFIAPEKPGTEISENLISPRLHIRYDHNPEWTSRWQLGQGYRAPLSFFESDHGILDNEQGYKIEVDELEKSISTSYVLAYNSPRTTANTSIAYNEIENLTSLEEDENGIPVLSQLDETAQVTTLDAVVGYQLNQQWLVGASFENFEYSEAFKQSYAIAPIEQRIQLSTDYEAHGWNWNSSLTWIAARDLSDYGYEGYNTADGDESSLKTTDAPAYFTIDSQISKRLNDTFSLYAGVKNLLDYTQAGDEDSPLFYSDNNDPDSYDVGYIYGPLQGRLVYSGLRAKF